MERRGSAIDLHSPFDSRSPAIRKEHRLFVGARHARDAAGNSPHANSMTGVLAGAKKNAARRRRRKFGKRPTGALQATPAGYNVSTS
ncbi:hypothetical protein [Luteimonas suaedae]|uniref:hypothetical protein n=1 Tax=Luteimonas suaedae TaxID=2605430 RepID=UPI0011EC3B7F|nr:hypothetical protein [Luteimonas suaedae]